MVNSYCTIRYDAIESVNQIVKKVGHDLIDFVCKEGVSLENAKRAVNHVFTKELAKHANLSGNRYVAKYESEQKKLLLWAKNVHNAIKSCSKDLEATKKVSIYITGALEYLLLEILELSASATINEKRQIIIPKYMKIAIGSDDELSTLIGITLSPKKSPKKSPKRSPKRSPKGSPKKGKLSPKPKTFGKRGGFL